MYIYLLKGKIPNINYVNRSVFKVKNRKFVKLRVDMYSDTKFKIIDTMEDRDLIHYIWTRLITLCGHVNLDGDLYMSKTIPYIADTLAIEFNRSVEKVKLALKVFMDLEMIEISKENVYKISNFAKHQNIKVKEGADKKEDENNSEVKTEINNKNQKKAKIGCENVLNIIGEDEACTKDNSICGNIIKEGRDINVNDKEVNSKVKLEADNKDKVINFENKYSDLIRSEGNNPLKDDKRKRWRRYKNKADEIENICIDECEEEGACGWSDGDVVEGDVIEIFTF